MSIMCQAIKRQEEEEEPQLMDELVVEPMISLCMATTATTTNLPFVEALDVTERLRVCMSQEALVYNCRNYLTASSDTTTSCGIDGHCREQMCEWTFRVVNHFQKSREVVDVCMSLVDRFMDLSSGTAVDKTVFKLASMTALHMATKMHTDKYVSLTSLADLSRGEFTLSDLREMEHAMLEVLEWRMNPPTLHSYIEMLLTFQVPSHSNSSSSSSLYDRACFFAELSLLDFACCSKSKFMVALCSILNAMEGLGYDMEEIQDFVELIKTTTGIPQEALMEQVRELQWVLYSHSQQSRKDAVGSSPKETSSFTCTTQALHAQEPTTLSKQQLEECGSDGELSPVSVSRRRRQRL